jgi:transposase
MGRAKPPITNDVRRLFLSANDRKAGTLRDLAGIFQFSETFGKKLLRQRRANGHADRIEQRRSTPRRLPLKHRVILEHWIKEDPQQTLTELKDRLLKERGVEISVPQICRVRKALGVRVKPRPVGQARPEAWRHGSLPKKRRQRAEAVSQPETLLCLKIGSGSEVASQSSEELAQRPYKDLDFAHLASFHSNIDRA